MFSHAAGIINPYITSPRYEEPLFFHSIRISFSQIPGPLIVLDFLQSVASGNKKTAGRHFSRPAVA